MTLASVARPDHPGVPQGGHNPTESAEPSGAFGGDNSLPLAIADRRPIRAGIRQPFGRAARRIVEHARGLRSVKVSPTQLRVSGDRLIAPDGEYRLEDEGRRRLAGHFRAPMDYLNRLPPQLRDQVLNYHLRDSPSGTRIYHREGSFVDLGRCDLHTLESAQVLDAVRDGFGNDALYFEAYEPEIANEAFSLDLVSPRIAMEVRRGDEIQAGVRVEHSYTGDRATTVYAFVVRLVCTNGMVQRQCVGLRRTSRTRRLNADRENAGMLQFDQIKRLGAEVRQEIEPILEAIKKLTSERADEAQLKQFLGQARMNSRGLVEQLRAAWEAEGSERTKFGLFNALTRLATHGNALSARQRGALARMAGIYANSSTHLCPHCFSVLNNPSGS